MTSFVPACSVVLGSSEPGAMLPVDPARAASPFAGRVGSPALSRKLDASAGADRRFTPAEPLFLLLSARDGHVRAEGPPSDVHPVPVVLVRMGQWVTDFEHGLIAAAGEPWALVALFALVVADAFLVVLPSETVVVALGALALSTGTPALGWLLLVAASGAVTGDSLCYLLGRLTRRAPLPRWRPLQSALERADRLLATRAATLIVTARYIPFARIAVNLTAGAREFPYRRFLPLSALAGMGWACVTALSGAAVGALVGNSPLIAVAASIAVALVVGLGVDAITSRLSRRTASPVVSPSTNEGILPPQQP